jgi:hypothetical protein
MQAEAETEGTFQLEVSGETQAGRDFISGAGAFLIEGLTDIAEQYPANCKLTVDRRDAAGTPF